MMLKGIAQSAALLGLQQDRTLESQPPGTPNVICPEYNEIAAGILLSELGARNRVHNIPPSELELSVLMKFLGAQVTHDNRIVVDEGSLYDLFRLALSL